MLMNKLETILGRLADTIDDIELSIHRLAGIDSGEPHLYVFVPNRITKPRVRPEVICFVCYKFLGKRSLLRTNQTPSRKNSIVPGRGRQKVYWSKIAQRKLIDFSVKCTHRKNL